MPVPVRRPDTRMSSLARNCALHEHLAVVPPLRVVEEVARQTIRNALGLLRHPSA